MFAMAKNGEKCRFVGERSQIKVFLVAPYFKENAIFGIINNFECRFLVDLKPVGKNFYEIFIYIFFVIF